MKKAILLMLSLVLLTGFAFANGAGESAAPVAAAPATDVVEEAAMAYFANLEGKNIIKEDLFLEKVAAGEDMFVIDIRRPDDYAAGHIKGAVSIPWGPMLASSMNMIPQSGQVYVYCYSGQTAGQAIALMNMAGIPAKSVRYGFSRGISQVDGYETHVTTDGAGMATIAYDIDPAIQAAVDAYYADLGAAPFKNNIVAAADANAIREAGEDVQFVDFRTAEDFAKGHIEGAVQVNWGNGMQESFANLPADKKLIVNCYSGQTAGQTTAILRVLGYDAVSINSGMGTPKTGGKGYISEGFATVM